MKYNDKKFKVIGAVHTPIFYIKFSKQSLILFVLLGAILFIGIGYSAINSVTAEITGGITATTQNGVFITDVTYVSGVDANVDASNIEYYRGTMLQSLISLSEQNPNSEIKYKVTIYNNSEETYPFVAVLYDEEFYDNPDIVFEISGFNIGETIGAKETKELYITFKYKNQTIPEKTILSSYINFKIAEPNRLMAVTGSGSTAKYLRGTVIKNEIEEIEFAQGTQPPEGTINELSFDASEKQDKSIMGYYTDTDGNGLYKLTFLSPEIIATTKHIYENYLFSALVNLKTIKFDNFSTWGTTRMHGLFNWCSKLETLDLSKFDTSKVTGMGEMFSFCSSLTTLDVSILNTSNVTNMNGMFNGCSQLTTLDLSNFNTSNVTNMNSMFSKCNSLATLDVSKFNTENVKEMKGMFDGCSGLTTLDLNNFDTSNVTTMRNMFLNCGKLIELNISNFNTSNVKIMSYMFQNCSKLIELDTSNFNTNNVTEMTSMFYGCKGLTTLNVSGFNTKNVTAMGDMFNGCGGLTILDVNNFDTSNVTGMGGMFSGCSGLTTLDLSNFDTSNVTSMGGMFRGCWALNELNLSNFNVIAVKNASLMFYQCGNIKTLNLSNFSTNNVENMYLMFGGCRNLTTIYVSEFNAETSTGWTTTAVTNSVNMFSDCTNIIGGNGTTFDSTKTDKTYAVIDTATTPGYLTNINKNKKINRLISASRVAPTGKYLNSTIIKNKIETIEFKLGKEKPEGTIETFDASEKQDESIMAYYTDTDRNGLYELTFTSDGVIATNTETQYLFQSLTQLTKITFDNFSTYGATNMQSMFSNCSKLITLDVSKFNTSNVTSMLEMFYNCKALTTLNLSNFNTSSVTNMQTMFSGCMALTTLDLSGFNTINVITMRTMFNNCKALTTIYVSEFNAETSTGWTTTAVTNSTSMFSNCTNIIGGNGTTYNNNITDKTYAVIDTAETPGYLTNINHRWRKN